MLRKLLARIPVRAFNDGEELAVDFGSGLKRGVRVYLRYRSAVDGITPWYLFGVFVWGTFLGANPYRNHRCASNGINLVCLAPRREP